MDVVTDAGKPFFGCQLPTHSFLLNFLSNVTFKCLVVLRPNVVSTDFVVEQRLESNFSVVVWSGHQTEPVSRHGSHKTLSKIHINIKFCALHVSLRYLHYFFFIYLLSPNLLFVGGRASENTYNLIDYCFGVTTVFGRKYNSHVLNHVLCPSRIVVLEPGIVLLCNPFIIWLQIQVPVMLKLLFLSLFILWA